MKKKCEKCRGKGGWTRMVGRFSLYVSCVQCKGKGAWWTEQMPKRKVRS